MIACDSCDQWYHLVCVGIKKSDADAMPRYECPNCLQVRLGHSLNHRSNHAVCVFSQARTGVPAVFPGLKAKASKKKKRRDSDEDSDYAGSGSDEDFNGEEDDDGQSRKKVRNRHLFACGLGQFAFRNFSAAAASSSLLCSHSCCRMCCSVLILVVACAAPNAQPRWLLTARLTPISSVCACRRRAARRAPAATRRLWRRTQPRSSRRRSSLRSFRPASATGRCVLSVLPRLLLSVRLVPPSRLLGVSARRSVLHA
jgi:hypothetical protein